MASVPVRCPYCHTDQVVKRGKTETGKQRYRCQNSASFHASFVLDPAYSGHLPEVKRQIVDMALNGSGIRDTARVLGVSSNTVLRELKKKNQHSSRLTRRS